MSNRINNELLNGDSYLNLAAYIPESQALGPGLRAVIWVQGCPFSCSGCIAPEWIPFKKASYVKVESLAREIQKNRNLTGVTISGGEPMLQAPALVNLITRIKSTSQLDVICFTGFTMDEILNMAPHSKQKKLLDLLDILIDGPYISELNNDSGLRGSTNQRIIRLSGRYTNYDLENMPRHIEITITQQTLMMVGIPTKSENLAINGSYNSLLNGLEG